MHVLSSCSRGNCAQTRHAQGCQSGWAVCIMHVGGILGCCFISERLDTDGDGGRSSYKTELSGLTAEAHLCVSLCLLWEQFSVLLFVKIYRKSSGICPQTLMGRRGKGRLEGGGGGIVVEWLLTLIFSYQVLRGSALISDDFIMPSGGTPSVRSDLWFINKCVCTRACKRQPFPCCCMLWGQKSDEHKRKKNPLGSSPTAVWLRD